MAEYVRYPLKISYEIQAVDEPATSEADNPVKLAPAWGQEPDPYADTATPKLAEYAVNGTSHGDDPVDQFWDFTDADLTPTSREAERDSFTEDDFHFNSTELDNPIDDILDFTNSDVRDAEAPEPIVGGTTTVVVEFPHQVGFSTVENDTDGAETWDMIA